MRAADGFLDRLDESVQLLSRNKMMGRARDEIAPSLRSFPVGDYLILYKPIENGVQIVRVVSGYRDLDEIL